MAAFRLAHGEEFYYEGFLLKVVGVYGDQSHYDIQKVGGGTIHTVTRYRLYQLHEAGDLNFKR